MAGRPIIEYYDDEKRKILYKGYLDENHDRTGHWIFYDENGRVKEEADYEGGSLVRK